MQTLSPELGKKYASAINQGFVTPDTINDHSFCSTWVRRHPNRVSVLARLRVILGRNPEWQDLTDELLYDLTAALSATLAPNSVRTICAELRAHIARWAPSKPIITRSFSTILRTKKQPSQGVYLTLPELRSLHAFQPYTPRERFAKELFMRECLTGARAIDSRYLTPANIHPTEQGDVLTYVPRKHPVEVTLPVHAWLPEYLHTDWPQEYYKISNSYLCVLIRRIAFSCGICAPVSIFRAGKLQQGLKYEFIGTHTGRRTFATLLFLRGCTIDQIALMMGHIRKNVPNVNMTAGYIMERQQLSTDTFRLFT